MPRAEVPLFSILTVTLNGGDGLCRTVASVDEQEHGDYEHLVKDGGSLDGSLERVPGSSRRRVVTAPDSGIYDAMNQALAMSRGRFVLFLNAGDVLATPTALRAAAEALRAAPETELLYCDYFSEERGAVVASPPALSEFFLYRTMLCHQSYLCRSDVYRRLGGFDTSFRIAADYEFLARAVLRGGVRSRYAPLLLARYQGGGFSTRRDSVLRLRQEVRAVRARHLPRSKRLVFGAMYALTLPSLRGRLASHPGLGRVYTGIVNGYYKVAALATKRDRLGDAR
ncbi:glycosyltransferase family 2 protein [Anaeromyxobacter sp. Fw109-5]|uniref:glycosyltransferase family 2 protein n=1 Tax=Anaeromyxobacter sp. (strain Fw109-5) TaxID=404589 RepID=UPI0000ED7F81|nr:glycosyltransferase family 2 protein [Anaeromyxobacter sp. Fw109-5]ABS25446.1 glycosyl transferase family 2 [Anaeromyxobacter sp. Fw109-5]